MKFAHTIALALSLCTSLTATAHARCKAPHPRSCGRTSCPIPAKTAPPKYARPVSQTLKQSDTNYMLRFLRVPELRGARVIVVDAPLDSDPRTAEALVTIVSPRHCSLMGCTTLVMQASPDNQLSLVGYGRGITVTLRSTSGWTDLNSTDSGRAGYYRNLRWCQGRYQDAGTPCPVRAARR